MTFLDTSLSILIIVSLLLIVIARITKQTIVELFRDFAEFIQERKEDATEPYLG
jgi:hypothetical protein